MKYKFTTEENITIVREYIIKAEDMAEAKLKFDNSTKVGKPVRELQGIEKIVRQEVIK